MKVLGFMAWRGWLPAFTIAGVGGLTLMAFANFWASFGYALVLFVPFVIGWALGYEIRVRTIFLWVVGILLFAVLIVGAITLDLAGVLCTLILAAIIIAPALAGVFVGQVSRIIIERRRRRGQFLSILFFLPPIGALYGEAQLSLSHPIEVVETTRELTAKPEDVWKSLVFYEEITTPPPALARIGLPHPLYTRGTINAVGDRTTCVYDKGYLVKQVTHLERNRLLAFDVIEQVGIEDRSIKLIDGSFALEATDRGTLITLTTRYRPLLAARVFWQPFEHSLTRVLHQHVLDAIEMGGAHASDE